MTNAMEQSQHVSPDPREVVARLYTALAEGDAGVLRDLLADDVEVVATPGLPAGLGGTWKGSRTVRGEFWGRIAREFSVTADVDDVAMVEDGRVLVLGTYRSRSSDRPLVEAAFAHVLHIVDGRLHRLVQITDSHRWHEMPRTGAAR